MQYQVFHASIQVIQDKHITGIPIIADVASDDASVFQAEDGPRFFFLGGRGALEFDQKAGQAIIFNVQESRGSSQRAHSK